MQSQNTSLPLIILRRRKKKEEKDKKPSILIFLGKTKVTELVGIAFYNQDNHVDFRESASEYDQDEFGDFSGSPVHILNAIGAVTPGGTLNMQDALAVVERLKESGILHCR